MPSITAALREVLAEHDQPVEHVLSRHLTDGYRQSTNGEWIDRATFAQQLAQLRQFVEHVEIRVLDELTVGSVYAERHTIHITGRDGSVQGQEVFLFGEVADDGRLDSLEELVRPLPAS